MSDVDAGEVLAATLELSRELLVERSEQEIVASALDLLVQLLPGRALLVRTVDLRDGDDLQLYERRCVLRSDLVHSPLVLKPSAIAHTQLKGAVANSARLRTSQRYDSPFQGIGAGFCVPLVASGELYGALDVGYPVGLPPETADETTILPLANLLAIALRNERLHRDTTALRDYQARLIDHASALILGIDRDWRIRVCNRALCELLGISQSELIGCDLRDRFATIESSRLTQIFAAGMRGDRSAGGDAELVRSDGRKVQTVWSVAPVSSRGKVQAVVAIGQDRTVLSSLQQQLVQAEKLATLGQLAAGVAHELNNPLTSISVYSDYLLKRSLERAAAGSADAAEEQEKLRRIGEAASRLQIFARDLVQYAKPSEREPRAIPINAVVSQALSFCEHLFSRSDVELICELPDELPMVLGVPGQLEQVVINLVTNAFQSCTSGGQVVVRTWQERSGFVALAVRDNGAGIAPDLCETIFEPFYSTKTDGNGTGLGLSIVRSILDLHNGSVSVRSMVGRGSEFLCLVPVVT